MVILDTHSWIWYVTESPKLSKKAQNLIKESEQCGVSAISCWEVAMLIEKKRIGFSIPIEIWMEMALNFNKIKFIPLSPEICILSSKLENFHGDPSDRIITATSIIKKSVLITKDDKIISSKCTKTAW